MRSRPDQSSQPSAGAWLVHEPEPLSAHGPQILPRTAQSAACTATLTTVTAHDWIDGEQLLLIVNQPRTAVAGGRVKWPPTTASAQLLMFGTWTGDHLLIPRANTVALHRTPTTIAVSASGQRWGTCTIPPSPRWLTATNALLGVVINRSARITSTDAFIDLLTVGRAVIAEIRIQDASLS